MNNDFIELDIYDGVGKKLFIRIRNINKIVKFSDCSRLWFNTNENYKNCTCYITNDSYNKLVRAVAGETKGD